MTALVTLKPTRVEKTFPVSRLRTLHARRHSDQRWTLYEVKTLSSLLPFLRLRHGLELRLKPV